MDSPNVQIWVSDDNRQDVQSAVVEFRAKYKPVQCDVLDYTSQTKTVDSFGRKRSTNYNEPTIKVYYIYI